MSEKLKIVIIDDEFSAINALKTIIEEFVPQFEIIGTANSAREGMEMLNNSRPDVVFIDIQMPHMTGIELLQSLDRDIDFEIIFMTAYNNYAQEAFKLNAFYYLLKPINIPDFLPVVEKVTEKKHAAKTENRRTKLEAAFGNKLSIPSSSGIEFITISDIVRVEAAGSYVEVFLISRKSLVFSKNLKSMETLLYNHSFFRAHKSHLININYIQRFVSHKDGGTITMSDGSEIDLSRSRKDEFVSMYKS